MSLSPMSHRPARLPCAQDHVTFRERSPAGNHSNGNVTSSHAHNGGGHCSCPQPVLGHMDFWPQCLTRALKACDATFENFETLVERANRWLGEYVAYDLICAETIDKKVIYVKDIYTASMFFSDEDGPILATHIKGLRLWYKPKSSRISYNNGSPTPASAFSKGSSSSTAAVQIAFLDTIPAYLNPGLKHPKFETLPQTIDKINRRLRDCPLPGQVLSVETVTLKIAREDWSSDIRIDPYSCQWYDEYNIHQLSFIRLFYLKGQPVRECIGVVDFPPKALDEGGIFHPAKYSQFSSLVRQLAIWIQKSPGIRITNMQTLDTKHRRRSENHGKRFNTNQMFEFRIEERFRAYYIRVGYVKPTPDRASPDPAWSPETGAPLPMISCRSYFPLKRSTGYENTTEILQRVERVIKGTGALVYHVETVPMPEWITRPELCEKGERTFFDGEWYFVPDQDGNDRGPYRYSLAYALRVYYDALPGDSQFFRSLSSTSQTGKSCCRIM